MSRIRDIADLLLTLVVGRRCPGCGQPGLGAVCTDCVDELRHGPAPRDAGWLDGGVAGRLVRAGKLGQWRGGGVWLADALLELRPGAVPEFDVVTWIPADPGRRAERGGHLPERLAVRLARRRRRPARPLLAARSRRRPQRGLDRRRRVRNVAGAFRLAERVAGGTRVLLVDDVRTTGATLASARAVLVEAGAAVTTFAVVGVDRAIGGPAGVPKHARSEEIRLRNRTTRADESVTLRKGSSLLAPRPP